MNRLWTLLELKVTKLDYRSEENGGGGGEREIDTLGPEGTVCASMDNIWSERFNCP